MKQRTVSYNVTFERKTGKVGKMPVELATRHYAIGIAYHEDNDFDGQFSHEDLDSGLIQRLEEECRKAMLRDPTLQKYSARATQGLPLKKPDVSSDDGEEGEESE
jgi:hypothetical protein